MTEDWFVVAPLLIIVFGGLAMMLVDAFTKAKAELAIVTTVILMAAAIMSLGLFFNGPAQVDSGLIGSYLAYDKLAHILDIIICGAAALASLLAGGYLREHKIERGEFYVVLLFSTFGAMALGRAVDLLSMFIALETMSLGVYGLVAYRRHSPRAAEGALKYFLLGSFASAILLFGMALLYGATGHTNLHEIGTAIEAGGFQPTLFVLATLLLVVGLAFKVSAVPFHAWVPDAYEGAVTPATTFMAVVVKVAVFGLMIRLLLSGFSNDTVANADSGWPPALATLAAITLVVGNLAALNQKSVKRMLAYSSISHAGFLLVGVVASWQTGEHSSILFYLMGYAVSNILAFGSLILVGSYGKEAVTYEDLAGVGRRHPVVALPFTLGILSLMGFPPLAGFFGKYYVVLTSVGAGGPGSPTFFSAQLPFQLPIVGDTIELGLVSLAVLAVVMSAVGAYYYLRVLVYMFMKTPEKGAPIAVPMRSGYVVGALVIASYFVLRMGVTPDAYLALVSDNMVGDYNWVTYLVDGTVAVLAGAVAAALTSMRGSSRETSDETTS